VAFGSSAREDAQKHTKAAEITKAIAAITRILFAFIDCLDEMVKRSSAINYSSKTKCTSTDQAKRAN